MKNIDSICKSFKESHTNIDYLVLTQGIASVKGRTETEEGIDEKLQLHYFGRMYFIEKLLPLLRCSEDGAKVLSVLSGGVHKIYEDYEKDFELKTKFSIVNAANAAGFYNDVCLQAYSNRPENSKVAFFHAAPGIVNTKWGRDFPWYLQVPVKILFPLVGKSIDDCGEIMSNCLLNENPVSGFHIVDQHGNTSNQSSTHKSNIVSYVWNNTQRIFSGIL